MRKITIAILAGILVMAACVVLFLYRFGHNDAVAIAGFLTAYEKYDQAVDAFSASVVTPKPEGAAAVGKFEQAVDLARMNLNSRSSARISSLTRHDGDLMTIMQEIATLSGKEVDVLKAYQSAAANNTDKERLAKAAGDLTKERRADYARLLALAGQ